MKTLIPRVTALCSIALLTGLPLRAQTAAPARANGPPAPGVGQDVKEKAEDAALLQELDADQQVRGDAKPKRERGPSAGVRIGGGRASAGVAPVATPFRMQNLLNHSAPGSRALVIRTSDPDAKTQAALEEDLAVMSHLFIKTLEELPGGQGNPNKIMGIDVFFTPAAAPVRSLYLDNYGAVFFLNVNFPLVAPPEKRAEEKPVGDSAWEDARQELYGQRLQGGGMGELAEDFNQEKVDKLRDTLLDSLKNATNIRGLKPTEFVTVWVSGGSSAGPSKVRMLKTNPAGNLGGNIMLEDHGTLAARRTVLTIRVTKAEIDSFAKGTLTHESFQKSARITAYTGDATGSPAEIMTLGGYAGRNGF